jgi:hypothetical protein
MTFLEREINEDVFRCDEDLIALYVMGCLSEKRKKQVQMHLFTCEKCSKTYQEEILLEKQMSTLLPSYWGTQSSRDVDELLSSIGEIENELKNKKNMLKTNN